MRTRSADENNLNLRWVCRFRTSKEALWRTVETYRVFQQALPGAEDFPSLEFSETFRSLLQTRIGKITQEMEKLRILLRTYTNTIWIITGVQKPREWHGKNEERQRWIDKMGGERPLFCTRIQTKHTECTTISSLNVPWT